MSEPDVADETPFPPQADMPPVAWAILILRLWRERGEPVLLGVPAEQLHEVRRILGLVRT